MLATPMDVLKEFPIRKSKAQKQAFRDAVQAYGESLGYETKVEKGSFGSHNVILGDPDKARFLVTAHYDTCAVLPVPNLLTPCNLLPFVGYQIFITVLIMLPCILVGVTANLLLPDSGLSGVLAYVMVWTMLLLMFIGPANKNNANDNTSGIVTLLEIAKTMPENQREKVCFVLFDLEEAGLIGSTSYRKAHKKVSDNQIVLNLDCVGDGDHIRFFPSKKMKQDKKLLTGLYTACGYFGKKDILVREKGFAAYPSDQKHFPYGVGICALRPSRFGLYLGRIHTKKDTVLEQTNVNLLRAALISYMTQAE